METVDLLNGRFIETGKGLDPVGRVYVGPDGRYFRGVRAEANDWLLDMQRHQVFEKLQDRALIPQQKFLGSGAEEFCAVLVSNGGDFPVHASQYPLLTFKDAALKWIEINQVLASINPKMGLIDGHYLNFAMFSGVTPKWVDLGSISVLKSSVQGIREFIRYFIVPLVIFNQNPERSYELRQRIRHPRGGITAEEASGFNIYLPEFNLSAPREKILEDISKVISGIDFSDNKNFWSSYRAPDVLNRVEDGTFLKSATDSRFETIANIINGLNPGSIIDIGANDGLFSFLISNGKIPVIAIDTDDFSLNKIYRFVKSGARVGRAAYAACAGFSDVEQKADTVMALALTHHLVLSQKLTFDDVANKLSSMARKSVITEYMPDGLGGTRTHPAVQPNPLPDGYSLENYMKALKSRFRKVEVVDYERSVPFSRRTLIVCDGVK